MPRWRARLAALLVTAAATAAPVGEERAQELPASLIADQVTYDRETRILTASGNVEVLYQGRVLRAERIVYDEGQNQIRAEGDLLLTDPAGGVLMAESAALTPDLDVAGGGEDARLAVVGHLVGDEARRHLLGALGADRRRDGGGGEQEACETGPPPHQPSSRCRSRLMARRIAATGGVHAATRSGIWPRPPRDSAKSLRK